MDAGDLRIERLSTIEQFRACEALQRRAWGMDDRDIVPLHLLITFQTSGGLVLGAFDERGEMVGTLFGFLGAREEVADERALKHCSHMMGVREDWRGRGVGYRLKLAQREHALRQGLDLITWTYDPLESLNASLNVRKLGGVCNTYVRDLYGEMSDERNAGLGSDRFRLDWWIASDRVAERLAGGSRPTLEDLLRGGGAVLNPASIGRSGHIRPSPTNPPTGGRVLLVEVPADIQAIKTFDLDLARAWRSHVRDVFESCFASGYTVVDFTSEMVDGARRSFYVLEEGFEVD